MAKKTELSYTQRRAADLKAKGACTTCGVKKGSGTKAVAEETKLPPKAMKELKDAPSWKVRLERAKRFNFCYACGTLAGTGTKVSTNGAVKAEPKPAKPAKGDTMKRKNKKLPEPVKYQPLPEGLKQVFTGGFSELRDKPVNPEVALAMGEKPKMKAERPARKAARKAVMNATVIEAAADANAALVLEEGAHADSPEEREAMERGIAASEAVTDEE